MLHKFFSGILTPQRHFLLSTSTNYGTLLLLKTCTDQLVELVTCTKIKRHFVTVLYRIIHLSCEDHVIIYVSVVGGSANPSPLTSVSQAVVVLQCVSQLHHRSDIHFCGSSHWIAKHNKTPFVFVLTLYIYYLKLV